MKIEQLNELLEKNNNEMKDTIKLNGYELWAIQTFLNENYINLYFTEHFTADNEFYVEASIKITRDDIEGFFVFDKNIEFDTKDWESFVEKLLGYINEGQRIEKILS